MDKNNQIVFLGGDKRQYTAASELSSLGFRVRIWENEGENSKLTVARSITEALDGADTIILPCPVSFDGITLNAPSVASGEAIQLELIASMLSGKNRVLLIGGKMPPLLLKKASDEEIECVDLFDSEVFLTKNAYITAEAAVAIAMENMRKTVRGSRFAITGYGRIAKQLARLLCLLGAEVTVCARKPRDIAEAELMGCRGVNIARDLTQALSALESSYDVIFNTVPSLVFDRDFLAALSKETLIIELASAPGGIDATAARNLGARVLWAPSLPGKYAPDSAGKLIAECILDRLFEGR